MAVTQPIRTPPKPPEPFLLETEAHHVGLGSWFVYLFALSDCSAFKVGFTCNPLQRIATFSRRYFERFDLSQSMLFHLQTCESARALERTLKLEFATHRYEAPAWIPAEAGGHTEWFSAVYFGDAEAYARTAMKPCDPDFATGAYDFFRSELSRVAPSFERWAFSEAQRIHNEQAAALRGYLVRDQTHSLRDWLDAFRYFDLPLFVAEPEVKDFVGGMCVGIR